MKCLICSNKLEDDELKLDVCDNGHSAKDIILFLKKKIRLLKKEKECLLLIMEPFKPLIDIRKFLEEMIE